MGGKSSKQTETVVCTNPRVGKGCSMERVKFTLQSDKKKNKVLLKDLEFKIQLPLGGFSCNHMCAISDDVYLLSCQTTNSILKLQLSSGKLWMLKLKVHAHIQSLFFLEQNRAAAAVRVNDSNYIYLIDVYRLRGVHVKVFPIQKLCNGVAQIDEMLYIGHFNCIAVYNSDGQRKKIIYEQDNTGTAIYYVAKGVQKTLICLEEDFSHWALKVVDTRGCLVRSFYRSKGTLPFMTYLSSLMRTDYNGNVYIHCNTTCLKITPEGNLETIQCPESIILDICYDENNDMLVFLCENCIVLRSLVFAADDLRGTE